MSDPDGQLSRANADKGRPVSGTTGSFLISWACDEMQG